MPFRSFNTQGCYLLADGDNVGNNPTVLANDPGVVLGRRGLFACLSLCFRGLAGGGGSLEAKEHRGKVHKFQLFCLLWR